MAKGYLLSWSILDLPVLTEKKIIEDEQLSDYTKSQYGESKRLATEKLILDFTDKTDYTVHIKNLVFYHKLGFKIQVKKGIKFRQESFLKSYIEFNTKLRSVATSEFEKDFFKLMNNSTQRSRFKSVITDARPANC